MLFKLLAALTLVGLVAGRSYHVTRREVLRMRLEDQCIRNSGDPYVWTKVEASSRKFSDCVVTAFDVNWFMVMYEIPTQDDSEIILDLAKLFMMASLSLRLLLDGALQGYSTLSKTIPKMLEPEMPSSSNIAFLHDFPLNYRICSKKATLQACFFDLVVGTLPCVRADIRNRVDDSAKAFAELGDYVCKDDAQIVTELLDKNAIACTDSKITAIDQCTDDVAAVNLEEISVPKACQMINNTIDCVLSIMRTCPNKVHADFLQRVYDTLMVGSRCDNSTVDIVDFPPYYP